MEYFWLYALGTGVTNWWNHGNQQIAFCRGEKGFIAFDVQYNANMNVNLQVSTKTKCTFEPWISWIYFVVPLDSFLVLFVERNVTGLVVGLFEGKWASKQCFCYTDKYLKTERLATLNCLKWIQVHISVASLLA